jgi:hypothetical protein
MAEVCPEHLGSAQRGYSSLKPTGNREMSPQVLDRRITLCMSGAEARDGDLLGCREIGPPRDCVRLETGKACLWMGGTPLPWF